MTVVVSAIDEVAHVKGDKDIYKEENVDDQVHWELLQICICMYIYKYVYNIYIIYLYHISIPYRYIDV